MTSELRLEAAVDPCRFGATLDRHRGEKWATSKGLQLVHLCRGHPLCGQAHAAWLPAAGFIEPRQLGEWKKDFGKKVRDWLEVRLRSALLSQQPLATAVELVQGAKDFPNVDGGSVVRSLLPEVVKKCHGAIMPLG